MLQPIDPNRDLKLCLGLAASGALAITPLALPANAFSRSIFPIASVTGSIAAIAKTNEYEYQDKQNQDARERWDALKQDMDDSLLISSQAFYTANPGAWIQRREVPHQWHEQYLNARFSPLPELPQPQFETVAQPQAQPIQQPGQVRAAATDSPGSGWGDYEPRPQPPIAQPPTLTNYSPPAQSSIAQVEYTPRLFDWQAFRENPDLFPHVCVLGSTGNGKTSLQEWLARLVGNGNELIVLTTKKKGLQWHQLPITGLGRDFAPISQKWRSVESALNSRCADLDSAQSQPQIICAIDELNDIIANSDLDLANVARAGREARIRLIVNSHSEGVEGLGLKGKNDIKACFVWVRLGSFAINHAQMLANKGLIENADIAWLKAQQRPCMVGDMVAKIPSLPEGWQSRLSGSQRQATPPPTQTPEPHTPPSFGVDFSPVVQGSGFPVQPAEPHLKALPPTPEPPSDREAELLEKFGEFKALGMNKAQICFALWGAKKGGTNAYKMASDFYDRLNSKYLEISGDNAA